MIEKLHLDGALALALACETRPLLQGARLTTWELAAMGAPHELIIDSAAAGILAAGDVDVVLVGADRIAANGDTANKIGTFSLAVAAGYAGVPFIVVAPESTVDPSTASGSAIEIEDRGADEVIGYAGTPTAPGPGGLLAGLRPSRLLARTHLPRRTVRSARAKRLVPIGSA